MKKGKIYFLNTTGEVILYIPENTSQWAVPTTRDQDEALYNPLQAYNPESIDVLELEIGQYASDFVSANGFRVNIETKEVLFDYPQFHPPLTAQLQQLISENSNLVAKNNELSTKVAHLEEVLEAMILEEDPNAAVDDYTMEMIIEGGL